MAGKDREGLPACGAPSVSLKQGESVSVSDGVKEGPTSTALLC